MDTNSCFDCCAFCKHRTQCTGNNEDGKCSKYEVEVHADQSALASSDTKFTLEEKEYIYKVFDFYLQCSQNFGGNTGELLEKSKEIMRKCGIE